MRIVTAGDGFACEHIFPMWPSIIEEMTDDTNVVRLGKVGAGNEYIFNSVVDYISQNKVDYVIVQWATSNRLDLIIEDEDNLKLMNSCDKYSTNNYVIDGNTWWLSSASDKIKNQIGTTQSKLRTRNYILSLEAILEKNNIPYSFFSSYRCDVFPDSKINWSKWIDIRGMEFYSKLHKFKEVRLDQVQPSTYVQRQYVLEFMKDKIPLNWKKNDIQPC